MRCAGKAFSVLLCVVAAAVLALSHPAARAEDAPPQAFYLDLDTGGHRAMVKDLAFTPDGQYLVSASDDKTIRIWDWRSGKSLRTLRGQIGKGNEGKVFAVAVSPDGATVAAAGYFGPGLGDDPPYGDVRLYDFKTGRIRAVLKAAEYSTRAIAFSPDGNYLAAGGQDGFAYVWRKDEASASGWTADKKLDADSWGLQRLVFVAGGRLAGVTNDNGIRLWDVAAGAEITLADESEPLRDVSHMALAASQDGALFATGSVDGQVNVWRAADGTLAHSLPKQDFLIGALAFAGNRLAVACGYRCADRNRTAVFDLGSSQKVFENRDHDGIVTAAVTSPDGLTVATAGGTRNAIELWDAASGARVAELKGVGEPVTAVGIDANGEAIAWGNANPCPERVSCPDIQGELANRLDLPSAERFFEAPRKAAGEPYNRAVHEKGQWTLKAAPGGKEDLENGVLEILQGGKVSDAIANDATNGYMHAAFTLIRDGLALVTGGNDGTIIEYKSAMAEFSGEFVGQTGAVDAIAVSEAAGLMLTGSADQTLALWNLETRELIVQMFFAGKEWVVWMPQGYYYSSDDGDQMIGWHVNQGQDSEARFVRAGQLKRYLWSPEMVRRAIMLKSAKAAVAEMRPGVDSELQRLLERKPPEFQVQVAEDQTGVREGFVAVEVTGLKEAGAEVGDFTILSNARKVGSYATRSIGGDGSRTVIEVPVEEGENAISITGENEFGYLTERSVVALGKPGRKAEKKGKLYVVAIGVNAYPELPDGCNGRSCDLRYPVADAAGILTVLKQKSAPLYTGMESLVLLNRDALDEKPEMASAVAGVVALDDILEPDSDTISDEIQDFLDKPGPDDTTIVFVAGHGINVDEDYYFIPTDGRRQDGDRWRRSSLVDWADIQKAVERADGTRFMLLDTCHAANAFNPRLEKDAADARIVVFSATAANSTAAELPELGHGVFTYSVLEGLKGAANTSGDGVRLLGLADYIYREVVRLTNSGQKPFYFISNMENILLAQP